MNAEFKAKFLQHIAKNKSEQGFTVAQLLLIIFILGILAAIALPAFLSKSSKCCASEAKQYVGSMNRGQQAYYLENGVFASTVENLGLGVVTQTTNYTYSLRRASDAAYQYGISRKDPLRSYVGGVFRGTIPNTTEVTTLAILCEAESLGRIKPFSPILVDKANRKAVCASGTRLIEIR